MPQTEHVEKHFQSSKAVRDIVIGMSDGLTVPFALAAGLSGAVMATRVVITAGLAEISAGAIAMGLGGYLAAKSDAEHYASEEAREHREVRELPEEEEAEIERVFLAYGVTREQSEPIIGALRRRPKEWVDFMMRFELGLEQPDPGRAWRSALTIASAYIAGGLIPLSPYMFLPDIRSGLYFSIVVTLVALAFFGYIKGRFTGALPWRSSLQTVSVGGVAAAAAFAIARAIS
jgi:vacuolar iron transporter family protein